MEHLFWIQYLFCTNEIFNKEEGHTESVGEDLVKHNQLSLLQKLFIRLHHGPNNWLKLYPRHCLFLTVDIFTKHNCISTTNVYPKLDLDSSKLWSVLMFCLQTNLIYEHKIFRSNTAATHILYLLSINLRINIFSQTVYYVNDQFKNISP